MLRNYLLIAIRTLKNNRFYTLINVLGLAFGLTICMLILCWVFDEYNVNKFSKNGDRIYRLHANEHWGGLQTMTITPIVMGDKLQGHYPEIESIVKVFANEDQLLLKTQKHTEKIGNTVYATSNFLKYFDYPLLAGNRQQALTRPDAIVITKELARSFFGTTNVVGNAIQLENGKTVQVTGVLDDLPSNADLKFQCILSLDYKVQESPWLMRPGSFSVSNYLVLHPGTDVAKLTEKMQEIAFQSGGKKEYLWLQPFEDIYLYNRYDNGKIAGGRIEYVRLFLFTAFIVLAIACINFMNLATAQASKRGREVGVRKSLGAARKTLIFQFAGEAMVMTLMAAIVAMIAVLCIMPFFNNLTGKEISLHGIVMAKYLAILLGITLITGLLAGSYPAFVLSGFSPLKVLKGDLRMGGGTMLRKNLVILQFVLSFGFIVGSLGIYYQTSYIYNRNLGVDKANMMYVQLDNGAMEHAEAIDNAVKQLPQVKAVTYTSWIPIALESMSADLEWEGKPDKLILSTTPLLVGYDFLSTMGIQLKEGRDFSRDFPSDSNAYIINESAARVMGMNEPLGKSINFWHGKGQIIGVVKNYHFNSMHKEIGPMVLMLQQRQNQYMMLKLNPGAASSAIAGISEVFKKQNPDYPLVYHFLDEEFDRLYKSESMLKQLATIFAVLAVFISCLGLLGLSVFTAEQRRKEISIRKVLGASVMNVTTTLSKEYLKPVIIAIIIATPISWYLLKEWLNGYAYHFDLTIWMFVGAALLAVFIALVTVSVQSVKAALTNPVKHLKSE
ncbi:ABC transporter permease [Chitinophaga silvatica]|uniref:ABC transporter permease n=1 Tax=Chitinophaga silvatica TaxID=2282649 RepID=A0A3E1YHQ3_9BACT|nr:ABC transporter permease [Chitinophaga silvatica]RFS26953.1 ABC transporter permease [Chitinophaga silvatica]